ncbi:MMPL family transporter [Actinokineospora xionganensis]|uniref:MMPL family transporter n=1 Tax=Actinokineospora xionganensis TaxID=2684470 RepID=A0ABR7KZV5_9PSEU|nr:MMPL family transporter [Actinokineospora xionganensis]MBC6445970.1 MMPL family transporter [Actinokineospora xionganensis]
MNSSVSVQPRPRPGQTPSRDRWSALAAFTVRRRWWVLIGAMIFVVLSGLAGGAVTDRLSAGGYTPASADSTQAERLLAENFAAGAPDLVLVAKAAGSVDAPGAVQSGRDLSDRLTRTAGVTSVASYWTTGSPTLRSEDGTTALIAVVLDGDEGDATKLTKTLAPGVTGAQGELTVLATGRAMVNIEDERLATEDLKQAEIVAGPITALILLITFGSLVAVGLPLALGILGVLGTFACLVGLSSVMDVSVFALNLTTALGFGLAVDFSLFMVTRFREELGHGAEVEDAIATTLRTVGRTVVFSAVTVLLSLSALLVFPIDFLRSLAFTVMAVVVFAALAAILVMPALLAVLGDRVNKADPFARLRRRSKRTVENGLWHRIAMTVMRRPVAVSLVTVIFLAVLAIPFFHVKFGLFDERILPASSEPHAAAAQIRDGFEPGEISPMTVVLPDARGQAVADYASQISRIDHVVRVDAPSGSYVDGSNVTPPGPASAALANESGSWLTVISDLDPNDDDSTRLVAAVREIPAPVQAYVGGPSAALVDTKDALVSALPLAIAIIVVSVLVLLFLFTGSVLIPLKALVLNMLSLSATFGALVYIFQDGHLRWLVGDFTVTGYVDMTATLLLFCLAFGLSMDYEIFLLSRIKEEYDRTGDNTKAVALGLQHTGRLFTAAALIFASVMGALVTSGVSLVKLAGLGMALAVLVDATLIRGLLVPAFMRLLGSANWWAPEPLRKLHQRIGVREG